jgi:hypothetical protein
VRSPRAGQAVKFLPKLQDHVKLVLARSPVVRLVPATGIPGKFTILW